MNERETQPITAMAPSQTRSEVDAVHVIANHKPSIVKAAIDTAIFRHRSARHDAYLAATSGDEAAYYADKIADIRQYRADTLHGWAQADITDMQTQLGMRGSIGDTPSGQDLTDLFTGLDRVSEFEKDLQAVSERTDPAIAAADNDVVEDLVKSGMAQMEVGETKNDFNFATIVRMEKQRLGRSGRIKARLAGLAIGIGAGLGILAAAQHDEPPRADISVSDYSLLDNPNFTGFAVGAAVIAGGLSGAAAAQTGNGHFARRAARREIRRSNPNRPVN